MMASISESWGVGNWIRRRERRRGEVVKSEVFFIGGE